MKTTYHKHVLEFKRPSGTSRGVLKTKETWFLVVQDGARKGIGECGILRSLSIDDRPDYEKKLKWTCDHMHWGVERLWYELKEYPSIQFGVEMAFKSLESLDPFLLFPSAFTLNQKTVPINGLIWMGDKEFMKMQITEKLEAGFDCIKMKIGAIDFDTELALLESIRDNFTKEIIELRVDANGAFTPEEALGKLERLSKFDLHSIEQPIGVQQYDAMKELCAATPLPIALDEELIGVFELKEKRQLLEKIKPQYIILKPSLIGGFRGTQEWISIAEELGIVWWITSALESNVGLNAIAQFAFTLESILPQGLGTGSLYTNNFTAPLQVCQGALGYDPLIAWDVPFIN